MMNKKGKHFKNRKETNEDIANRILSLAEPGDYGIFPPPMKAQVAVNELCRFFLGEDYWTIVTVSYTHLRANETRRHHLFRRQH